MLFNADIQVPLSLICLASSFSWRKKLPRLGSRALVPLLSTRCPLGDVHQGAKGEWKGDWCDGSKKWDKSPVISVSRIHNMPPCLLGSPPPPCLTRLHRRPCPKTKRR